MWLIFTIPEKVSTVHLSLLSWTSYGIWDGSSCEYCIEQNCYIDNGVDEETPCHKCGWFRGIFDGSRYPPGYCATSWRYATERIQNLRKEFPTVSKELISKYVQLSGENDMEARRARDYLMANIKSQEVEQHTAEKDDISFVLSLLQDQKNVKQEYRGDFVNDWTMDDMAIISAKIASKMKEVRNKFESGFEEVSCDSEFISGVSGYSFNKDFDSDISACLVDIVQELIGCFHCHGNNPTKICSNCKIARYCSKKCQKLSWKDTEEPHKAKCGKFSAIKNDPGSHIIVGLYTHCLLEGTRALELAMSRRTTSFLDEVVRCSSASWRESTARSLFNLDITIMDAFEGNAFLVAHCMFLDDKLQARWNDTDDNSGMCIGHFVLFKMLESGLRDAEYFSSRLERGDLPDGMKMSSIHHLSIFLKEANKRGIEVKSITCKKGADWLYEDEWEKKLRLAATDCRVSLPPKPRSLLP